MGSGTRGEGWSMEEKEGRKEPTLPLMPLGSGLLGSDFRALVLPYSTQGHQNPKQPMVLSSQCTNPAASWN